MPLALLLFCNFVAHAAPQPIAVPAPMRTCTKTSECEAVPLRCGCCQYQGISKMYVTDYLDQNQDPQCMDEPCHCAPLKLVPRCAKQRCDLVDPSAKPKPEAVAKTKTKTKRKPIPKSGLKPKPKRKRKPIEPAPTPTPTPEFPGNP